ncbi:MAG: DUF5668 domain-containing protein [Clostridia bacterium]|nr:DUF5668 domain-containing protein [Clostridia bacterium]
MKRTNLNVVIGVFLLIIGVLLGLETLNVEINIDYSITGWTFLSVIGILMMINDKKVTTVPSILIFVGIWNVLNELGVIYGSIFDLIWPFILIIVGVNLVFGKKLFSNTPANVQNNAGELIYNGIFSGVKERLTTKNFKGLTANAIFGGVELDLRDIEITGNVQMDISALFGGVSIILSEKYNVVISEPMALFGGTENKFRGTYDESRKTVYINIKAIFGGVELK